MEQYAQSLKRAAILADFDRQLRDAIAAEDEPAQEALAARYFDQQPWLPGDFYR
jgi:hypothetical protein